MRLETLIKDINEEMFTKIVENRSVKDKDAKETAEIVGLSAIKYGDLSNQATTYKISSGLNNFIRSTIVARSVVV